MILNSSQLHLHKDLIESSQLHFNKHYHWIKVSRSGAIEEASRSA
jgi:hypothetical protein